MAESVTFTNCYMAYFQNNPYHYPRNNLDIQQMGTVINTGWHILPNMMWRHLATPKQWAEFIIKYEAYHVDGISCTIFNPVPMTTQLAIQGTTAFTAFNNTIYSLGYIDTLYETSWYPWNDTGNDVDNLNLAFKEGLCQRSGQSTDTRYTLPVYTWNTPNSRGSNASVFGRQATVDARTVYPTALNQIPSGVFWDPMNRPDHLMELRPGKNSMNYSWECHDCDSGIWYNLDQLASWAPYAGDWPWDPFLRGQPGMEKLSTAMDPDPLNDGTTMSGSRNDYSWPNFANLPVVPNSWFWQEICKSLALKSSALDRKLEMKALGTEYQQYKYGPTQWFLKGLPLFDDQNTHITTTTQCCIKMSLKISAKKRRSAIYCPTWGPFGWKTIYSMTSWNRNMPPSAIRYRTGGARRTLNNADEQGDWNFAGEWTPQREDPYVTSTWPTTASTLTTATTSTAAMKTETQTTDSTR
nr:capsid protein [Mute swan feces associated chapparvovirus 2]